MTYKSTLKKLIYVACHRGTKENDILLGAFAKSHLETLSPEDLNLFEKLLDERDDDIFGWLMGHTVTPSQYAELCIRIKGVVAA